MTPGPFTGQEGASLSLPGNIEPGLGARTLQPNATPAVASLAATMKATKPANPVLQGTCPSLSYRGTASSSGTIGLFVLDTVLG